MVRWLLALLVIALAACTPSAARAPSPDGRLYAPADGGAVWHEILSDHFRLFTDLDTKTALERVDGFERTYDAMVQTAFPRGAAGHGSVVLLRSAEELHAFLPSAAGGVYQGMLELADDELGAMVLGEGLAEQSSAVFQHELAHRLLHAGFDAAPTWFDEGLATYFETMRVERDRVVLGDWVKRFPARPDGPYPTARYLAGLDRARFYLGADRSNVDRDTNARIVLHYEASWQLVHLLRNGPDPIRDAFRNAIAETNDGESFRRSFQAFVGDVGQDTLERAYAAHVHEGHPTSSVYAYAPSPRRAPTTTRELDEEETRLVWTKLRLFGADPTRAMAEIDRLLQRAPRSMKARVLRADLQLGFGHRAEARTAYDAILTEAPTSAPALSGRIESTVSSLLHTTEPEHVGELAHRLASVATTSREHAFLAAGLEAAGEPEAALAATAVGVRAHPKSYFLHDLRASLLASAGRPGEAAAELERALDLLPESVVRGKGGHGYANRLAEYREAAARKGRPDER